MIYVIVDANTGYCWNGSCFAGTEDAEFYTYLEALKILVSIDSKDVGLRLVRGNVLGR